MKKFLLLFFTLFSLITFTSCGNQGKSGLSPYVEKTYKYTEIKDAYDNTKLSTVNIVSYEGLTKQSIGSGTIIYSSASFSYVLTCYHVINNPTQTSESNLYTSCEITPFGSSTSYTVDLTDKTNVVGSAKTDLAIIKVSTLTNYSNFTSITKSDDDVSIAEKVFTVGSPAGFIDSFTEGYIANLNRKISVPLVTNESGNAVFVATPSCYQLDMTVNPGNSGGGLFDLNGNLIGVVNAKATWSSSNPVDGIGYAIKPSDIYYWYNQLEF